jgi:hypothetical protein
LQINRKHQVTLVPKEIFRVNHFVSLASNTPTAQRTRFLAR